MRGNDFLDKMGLVTPTYVEAADARPKRRKASLKMWCAMAACLCLVFGLAVPAMAASVPVLYDALYAVSPAVAQFFKPVQLSCEDNGIRMEVAAAYIHEDTAEIYVSMQDLEGSRIDETVDLFDSYYIRTPFDCEGHCELSGYDPDTRTGTFLITLKQMHAQNISGEKLTLSIREFLSNKKTYEGIIEGVSLKNIEQNAAAQTVELRGGSGREWPSSVLKPAGTICSPIDGAAVTGIGYVDGTLHVQVYYEDIHKTDNHGFLSLVHNETGEKIDCDASLAFWDNQKKGSYEDYIFTGIPADALGGYSLYGEFITSSGSVKGNWNVTFPLENTENK